MACGGLKFIDSGLDKSLSSRSSTSRTVQMALAMVKFIDGYTYKAGKRLHIKIGIHYGSCIFGVLGYHKPQFSLIGDTINTTSRHCTTGKNGNIVLSEAAWNQIKHEGLIKTTSSKVYMKGKGDQITVYTVNRRQKAANHANHQKKAPNRDRRSGISEFRGRFHLNPSGEQDTNPLNSFLNSRGSVYLPVNMSNRNSIILDSEAYEFKTPTVKLDNLDNSRLEKSMVDGDAQDGPQNDQSMLNSQGQPRSYSVLDEVFTHNIEKEQDKRLPEAEEIEKKQPVLLEGSNALSETPLTGDKDDIILKDESHESNDDADSKRSVLADDEKRMFYEKKMVMEYDSNITVVLTLMLLEVSCCEFFTWIDDDIVVKFLYFRFLQITFGILTLILIFLKDIRVHVKAFKIMVISLICIRTALQISEYFLSYYLDFLPSNTRVHS
jgi:hypothetical protein